MQGALKELHGDIKTEKRDVPEEETVDARTEVEMEVPNSPTIQYWTVELEPLLN